MTAEVSVQLAVDHRSAATIQLLHLIFKHTHSTGVHLNICHVGVFLGQHVKNAVLLCMSGHVVIPE